MVAAAHCLGFLEFPEDLGECKHGIPASIWQFPAARQLSEVSFRRGAIFQCHWADITHKKPTGLLSNIDDLCHDPEFFSVAGLHTA